MAHTAPEARPPVAAAVVGLQSGAPAAVEHGGNANAAAERHEHQHLHAAVAHEVSGAAVGDAFEAEVAPHIGVAHVGGHIVIEPPRLGKRVGEALCQLLRQHAEVGREGDVGRLLLEVKAGLVRAGPEGGEVHIAGLPGEAVFRREVPVLPERLLKEGHGLVRRGGREVVCVRGRDGDVVLALAGAGQGQIGPQPHPGPEKILPQPQRLPDAEAERHGPVFLQLGDQLPPDAADVLHVHAAAPGAACPGCKDRIGLAERVEEAG